MNKQLGWLLLSCIGTLIAGTALAFAIGVEFGTHRASEHFYGTCQGGEVYFERPDGKVLPAIGCAEIARHVR